MGGFLEEQGADKSKTILYASAAGLVFLVAPSLLAFRASSNGALAGSPPAVSALDTTPPEHQDSIQSDTSVDSQVSQVNNGASSNSSSVKVNVNGQNIPVPENGSVNQTINSDGQTTNVSVTNQSSSSNGSASNSSTVNINSNSSSSD